MHYSKLTVFYPFPCLCSMRFLFRKRVKNTHVTLIADDLLSLADPMKNILKHEYDTYTNTSILIVI